MRNALGRGILFLLGLVLVGGSSHAIADSDRTKKPALQGSQTARKGALSSEEKLYLLSLARETLTQYLKEGKTKEGVSEKAPSNLKEKRGCFVTLKKHGDLRGCIGFILPVKPVCDCVVENVINAAIHDTRFPAPVSAEELSSITIEISVLTVPEKLELKDRSELPNRLAPGRDGVILKNRWYQSTYLPQVWEDLPDKEEFLDSLCRKGGMPVGCWKDEDTEIFTYQAEVFREQKP
jgi:AmmeMemoRadiSam system protein A